MRRIGIIMNGVTGRMGTNQHLKRSILAVRHEGLFTAAGEWIVPEAVLVGRNAAKLRTLAELSDGLRWTTDLDSELAKAENEIYFDAQTTDLRFESVKKAIAARKHVYCEKPTGTTLEQAQELYRLAVEAGVKHGVVQDKLFLPGLIKLKRLIDTGFFGRILSVRGEFGYWVFTGEHGETLQRPSWNYRKEDGGGIILDMLCHWRYVLDNLFGEVRSVSCLGATHIPERWDEAGQRYEVTSDDSAYATFQLASGVIAQFNSSWAVRVRRDDLLTLQVDGTEGSAVAGLRECRIQHAESTPRAVWNPDEPSRQGYMEDWSTVSAATSKTDKDSDRPLMELEKGIDKLKELAEKEQNPEKRERLGVRIHEYEERRDRYVSITRTNLGAREKTPGEIPQNAFLTQWVLFLKHVVSGTPFPWDLREGAKGVQLAELGMESWQKRAWVDVPELPVYGGHER